MNKRVKSNSIRIIAGQWRGRKLDVQDAEGLRPTTDRVRETLFNWLMYDVQDARCLDLFAGTGALGYEALSRGAAFVQFVEFQASASSTIKRGLATLKVSHSQADVAAISAEQFLSKLPDQPFDLVFLDPPFAEDHLSSVVARLEQPGWLSDNAYVYIEQPSGNAPVSVPPHWRLHRESKAGQCRYGLYSLNDV